MDYEKLKDYRNNVAGFRELVGIELIEISEGYAKGRMKITDDHLNQLGIAHGGSLFSLADGVAGSAAASYGYKLVTLNSSFNFLSPGPANEMVYATARVVRPGRTIKVVDLQIEDRYAKTLCTGTFTFYTLDERYDLD